MTSNNSWFYIFLGYGKGFYTASGGPSLQLIFVIIIIIIFGGAALLFIIRFIISHYCITDDDLDIWSDEEQTEKDKIHLTNPRITNSKQDINIVNMHRSADHVWDPSSYSINNPGTNFNFPPRRQPSAPDEMEVLDIHNQTHLSSLHILQRFHSHNVHTGVIHEDIPLLTYGQRGSEVEQIGIESEQCPSDIALLPTTVPPSYLESVRRQRSYSV